GRARLVRPRRHGRRARAAADAPRALPRPRRRDRRAHLAAVARRRLRRRLELPVRRRPRRRPRVRLLARRAPSGAARVQRLHAEVLQPVVRAVRLLSRSAVGRAAQSPGRDARRRGSAVRAAVRRPDGIRRRPHLRHDPRDSRLVAARHADPGALRQFRLQRQVRRMTRISFVIPVYRNERAVTLTYDQIRQVMQSDLARYTYEIVFVDDGSDDGSLEELTAIRAGDANVRVVAFTRNFGQMAAILAGLRHATGDVIVQLSADLQDPISLVPQMVREYESGSEVVACHREHREDPWSRRVTSRALYGILRVSLPQIPPGGFDYILMDRKVVDAFNAVDVRNRFFQG